MTNTTGNKTQSTVKTVSSKKRNIVKFKTALKAGPIASDLYIRH